MPGRTLLAPPLARCSGLCCRVPCGIPRSQYSMLERSSRSLPTAFAVWVSMVIPITLLLAQVSFSSSDSHARHMWMLAGSSTCVTAVLHLSWRWIFRDQMHPRPASFAALNVAEGTMIGVVAATFACSDHNHVVTYFRGPYINVGVFSYALIASLGLGLGLGLTEKAEKSPTHHARCIHHVGFFVVFLAQWRDPDMESAYWQLNAAYSVDLLAVCTALIRNALVLHRWGIVKLPYPRASAHLKLAYVLVDAVALSWGLHNRISNLPFWIRRNAGRRSRTRARVRLGSPRLRTVHGTI